MPQNYFLAPAAARSFLAGRDIDLTYPTGANVTRTNNKREFFDVSGGPVAGQLGVGESLHDDPQPVFDDSDPPVQTGWNATVLFDETIPEVRGGIAEIEVKTRAFKRFAVYLIDSSAAKLTAINTALQNHKLYYGEVTSGIIANAATKNALLADIIIWRDEALAEDKPGLALGLDDFHTAIQGVGNLSDFRQATRDVLGITQADIDAVQIGQV